LNFGALYNSYESTEQLCSECNALMIVESDCKHGTSDLSSS